ncbi:MAG: hypothetical protein AAF797_15925 [Planctomycetota bacterium]
MPDDLSKRPIEIQAILKAQYRAGFSTLRQAIEKCPDELWGSSEGHAAAYWRIAFHALFFTHFYLQKDQQSMRLWPRQRGHPEQLDAPIDDMYSQADLLEYLDFCLRLLDDAIGDMDLSSHECGFPWYKQGKLEHQITNIRHLQHHAAQLGDRLRSATSQGLDWLLESV